MLSAVESSGADGGASGGGVDSGACSCGGGIGGGASSDAAFVVALAAAVLAVACCIGVDSSGDLESWASRWTLGLAWALGVRAGPVGLGFASL